MLKPPFRPSLRFHADFPKPFQEHCASLCCSAAICQLYIFDYIPAIVASDLFFLYSTKIISIIIEYR